MPVFTQAKPRGIKTLFPFRANMHPPPVEVVIYLLLLGHYLRKGKHNVPSMHRYNLTCRQLIKSGIRNGVLDKTRNTCNDNHEIGKFGEQDATLTHADGCSKELPSRLN